MLIGYDAKRIFHNPTGLGNYARSLISALATHYADNQYQLFVARSSAMFDYRQFPNIKLQFPQDWISQSFPALWRRSTICADLRRLKPHLFHGLSNELPAGISRTGVASVMTVHDLIFERFPESYPLDQRYSHRWKMKSACKEANAIIAASEQTKRDLIDFYGISPEKITVCYQHCSEAFAKSWSEEDLKSLRLKYSLPEKYFLFVSSITPRKNLALICEAMRMLHEDEKIPLVIIGDGKKEKENIKKLLEKNRLQNQVFFLNETPAAKSAQFLNSSDLPGIYQQAIALIYPSLFEGFGIPVLEAMWSRVPILCADSSSLPEVAGQGALYFNPNDSSMLALQMKQIASDEQLREQIISEGFKRTASFTSKAHAEAVMQVYQKLLE